MKNLFYAMKISLAACLLLFSQNLFGQAGCVSNLEQFDWLPALINKDDCCANRRVLTYPSGIFTYVYIEKEADCQEDGNELYFQDGTFYCADINGMDCRAAYNLPLDQGVVLWDCSSDCPVRGCAVPAENPAAFMEQLDPTLRPYLTLSEVFDTIDQQYYYTIAYTHDNNLLDFRLLLDCEGTTVCSGENYSFCSNYLGLAPTPKILVEGRRLDSTITICEGDSIQLEGFSRMIECDCEVANPQGPVDCFPFLQPGGQWVANGDLLCEGCITHTVHPKTSTIYTHSTPSYECPFTPPPIGDGGPLPPQGPVPATFPAGTEIHILVAIDPVCDKGPNCANNTGTIFFAPCDDGTEFFFLRTSEGIIYDPYFGTDIVFDYYDGQVVNFDFEPAPFRAPCSTAPQAILITCIEDASNPSLLPTDIFIEYPWLSSLVDETTCNINKVSIYNQGAFNFVYTEAASGNILYFENGDFYCADAPNFNCLELYGLTDLIGEWVCGEATNDASPPIPDLTQVTICEGDTIAFDYPFEICGIAPLVLVQNGGNLPQDFGNFHISEIENKIYFYPTATISYLMNPYQTGPEVIPTDFQGFCGNKVFEITVADNCLPDTMGRISSSFLSFEKEKILKPILFPNPTAGQLSIQLPKTSQNQELRVFDLQGRQLMKREIKTGSHQQLIDLSNFENGIYWVEWLDGLDRAIFKVVKH